jgi:hypothetical protein
MQFDMHFYGTFAMAYAAGLEVDHANIVATSSQLVDDNNLTALHKLQSGEAVMGVATAHHPVNAGLREIGIDQNDDRLIWVPFHFLPGNDGGTFEQRLVCVKNSQLAQQMVRYYTELETVKSHEAHCLHLIGIAAHVYADTFSHYGFSGIASELNGVDEDAIFFDKTHSAQIVGYIQAKAKDFRERFMALVAGVVNLGHGSVATYPDRPYLKWGYKLANGKVLSRDNPSTFLEACESLHAMFGRFALAFYGPGHNPRVEFSAIRSAVAQILSTEADVNGRIDAWKQALASGILGAAVNCPDYSETQWVEELTLAAGLPFDAQTGRIPFEGYNFYAAADYHRNYVLKRLLPSVGLFVA